AECGAPSSAPHPEDLAGLLRYDSYPRKSFIDHFYEEGVTLEQFAAGAEVELGDFVQAPYEHRVRRLGQEARLTLSRHGAAAGRPLRLSKEARLDGRGDALEVRYALENCPRQPRLHFAVELHFAGLAAGADDRYFVGEDGARAGQLQAWQDV